MDQNKKTSFFFGLLAGLFLAALLLGLFYLFFPSISSALSSAFPYSSSPLSSAALLPLPANCNLVQPIFSPGTAPDLVSLIREATSTIDIEMYVFTDDALARELAAASQRGVSVRVILESRVDSSSRETIANALRAGGVDVRWASTQFTLTHSKVMIIDGKKALVGSINFSRNAQNKNRETAVIIQGPALAPIITTFETDWKIASLTHPVAAATG